MTNNRSSLLQNSQILFHKYNEIVTTPAYYSRWHPQTLNGYGQHLQHLFLPVLAMIPVSLYCATSTRCFRTWVLETGFCNGFKAAMISEKEGRIFGSLQ